MNSLSPSTLISSTSSSALGPFLHLLRLSLALLVGTAAAAYLPLRVRLSDKQINAVSTFSTGLLVGAALVVVIPEGVTAVFTSQDGQDGSDDEHAHEGNSGWIGAALLAGFILMYIIDSLHGHDSYSSNPHPSSSSPLVHPHSRRPLYRPTPSHLAELEPLSSSQHLPPGRDSNDYTPTRARSPANSLDSTTDTAGWDEEASRPALGGLRGRASFRSDLGDAEDAEGVMTADASSVSTVIGLLTHSLADGISLGASSLASAASTHIGGGGEEGGGGGGSSLQLIVFLAIILHKAPTAFALSSLLSSSPATSPAFVRRALALFSLAAPVGALLTFLLLSLLGSAGENGQLEWWTGITLVFSGGTFLFVATHAVREQEKKVQDRQAAQVAEAEADGFGEASEKTVGQRGRLALVLAGMVTPGLLSRLVGHGH